MFPYVYYIGSEMGEKFPTCIVETFQFKELENNDAYALCNSFLGW